MIVKPATLRDLKQTEWAEPQMHMRSVKDEMRANLICKKEEGHEIFPGIVGYEDSVIPQIVNALLSRHNFILLGLRGQAKSRILRALATFLDDEIPVLAGSEVNDNPFSPISKFGRRLLDECGDATPIEWLPPHRRYVEKLATPDVTIADMIGDVDPIKAARGGHLLSDELTIHYGLLPRSNRGIFALNELPDLAGKIQVGLFNIMQEGDVQIKGYPIRLSLDVMLVFSANPEDYTARGKIITPLKDRIGSEIKTHYPPTVEHGISITEVEAWTERNGHPLEIPHFILEVIEGVAFGAREDKRIDSRSGVHRHIEAICEGVLFVGSVVGAELEDGRRDTIAQRRGGRTIRRSEISVITQFIHQRVKRRQDGRRARRVRETRRQDSVRRKGDGLIARTLNRAPLHFLLMDQLFGDVVEGGPSVPHGRGNVKQIPGMDRGPGKIIANGFQHLLVPQARNGRARGLASRKDRHCQETKTKTGQ